MCVFVGEKIFFSPTNRHLLDEKAGLNCFDAALNHFRNIFLDKKQAFVGEIQ